VKSSCALPNPSRLLSALDAFSLLLAAGDQEDCIIGLYYGPVLVYRANLLLVACCSQQGTRPRIPGHDGFRPLSSLLAIWPQKGLYRYQVWKAPDRPLCHLSYPPADLAGTHGAPMILCTPTFCPDQREAGQGAVKGPFAFAPFPFSEWIFGTARSGQGRAYFAWRSEPLTARTVLEHGREGKGSMSYPGSSRRDQSRRTICLVLAQNRPRHPDQFARQGYYRHILVGAGHQLI